MYQLINLTLVVPSRRISLAACLAPDRVSKKRVQRAFSTIKEPTPSLLETNKSDCEEEGCWFRRRRLDGALNRVPLGFYRKVWSILNKSEEGISIEGRLLSQKLTNEMVGEDFKFALKVEEWLNAVPQPEYRQLMVETLMMLALIVEHDVVKNLGPVVYIEQLIRTANDIFIKDQVR